MAGIRCVCGKTLNNKKSPNNIVLRTYSDEQYGELMDFIDSSVSDSVQMPEPNVEIWRCPDCKRMYVFENGTDKPVIYKIEKD